ncbi:22239_t:CDS:2 [Dentiscutata erythropus]|uniref:22239_t:CDS:1 n=1 Tax=Dentiscutata erythropus TaxID=1348616 RepID=A0A9N9DT99_9GLOM|nr:22239_t:CDS:2 [Dentiscutata erythropus]
MQDSQRMSKQTRSMAKNRSDSITSNDSMETVATVLANQEIQELVTDSTSREHNIAMEQLHTQQNNHQDNTKREKNTKAEHGNYSSTPTINNLILRLNSESQDNGAASNMGKQQYWAIKK